MDAIQNRAAHNRAIPRVSRAQEFGKNDASGMLTQTSAQSKVPNVSYSGEKDNE